MVKTYIVIKDLYFELWIHQRILQKESQVWKTIRQHSSFQNW